MNHEVSQQAKKRNMKPFWILLFMSGLPYVFGWFWFANMDKLPDVAPSNRGELISPVRSIDSMSLDKLDGSEFSTEELKGNWTMLLAAKSQCDNACLEKLYYMRQVRRLMGEERDRIKRVVLLMDDTAQEEFIKKAEPFGDMEIVKMDSKDGSALLKAMEVNSVTPENRIFIADPLVNLMMAYTPDVDPKNIAKDFRRLLKVVRIGKPKNAG